MSPPNEYDLLTTHLEKFPDSSEGWKRLIRIAEDSNDLKKISAAYDALLKRYPNTATAQIRYIGHHISRGRDNIAEDLFKRFLISSLSIDLWMYYLSYVRNPTTDSVQHWNTVCMLFEFALKHVGQDKDSGVIWNLYIKFLHSGEGTTSGDQQQRLDMLRKVYHRAVQIPLDNVECLWQDLEAFETSLNKTTAKKVMASLTPAYMQAKMVYRELVNHIQPLFSTEKSGLEIYLPALPRFDTADRLLVGKWKTYLKWEEDNPLELDEMEKATLISRIQGAYRKAVIHMRYYTEIWFMAYTWTNSVGRHDEAIEILKAGLEANPTSYLLTFAYAEALEINKDLAGVHRIYSQFLHILHTNLENIGEPASGNKSLGSSNGPEKRVANPTLSRAENIESIELQRYRAEYGLAWVMYMRFGMRAEGIKRARVIFHKARQDRWVTWEIYVAAAMNEYHCADDQDMACHIFEMGMEKFANEVVFVQHHLGFLISINDINNARALFQRAISKYSPEQARPLWDQWARYEYQYRDLENALKLEKRISNVYVSDTPIKRLAQRHTYMANDAIANRDLGFATMQWTGSAASKNSQQCVQIISQSTSGGPSNISQHLQNSQNHGSKRSSSPDAEHHSSMPTQKRIRLLSPPSRGNQPGGSSAVRRQRDEPTSDPRKQVSLAIGKHTAAGSFDGMSKM